MSLGPNDSHLHVRLLSGEMSVRCTNHSYRLVYKMKDQCLIIEVIAIGKRDKGRVYENASYR